MGPKAFQNTLFAVLFVILGLILSIFVISIPGRNDESTIARNGISRQFDVETFEGWVLTLDTLERQQEVLYAPEPDPNSDDPNMKDRVKKASLRKYPEQYLPSLIEEYGIAVQKPYSGNFLFQAQKEKLQNFLNNELVLLSESITMFKPTSNPINANDAVVLKAIEKYTLLLEGLNSRIGNMTYADSKQRPIGEIMLDGLTEDAFSDPIAYGVLATEHLRNNIRAHQSHYYEIGVEDRTQTPNIVKVSEILGVDPNSGKTLDE